MPYPASSLKLMAWRRAGAKPSPSVELVEVSAETQRANSMFRSKTRRYLKQNLQAKNKQDFVLFKKQEETEQMHACIHPSMHACKPASQPESQKASQKASKRPSDPSNKQRRKETNKANTEGRENLLPPGCFGFGPVMTLTVAHIALHALLICPSVSMISFKTRRCFTETHLKQTFEQKRGRMRSAFHCSIPFWFRGFP